MDEKRDDNMREQEVKPVSESEDKDVFKYRNTRESDRIRISFRNMVYIGDSDTDIPCMKLVNSCGRGAASGPRKDPPQ